jgi:hypothetical protein
MSVNDHISIKTIDVALTANIDTVETDDLYIGKDTKDIHLSRVAANILALGTGDALAVDKIYLDSANRDILLERDSANILGLASGDKLAVDEILLDRTNKDVRIYRSAANIGKTDDRFESADKIKGALGLVSRADVADYGGAFATYTPPTGEEGMIILAADTNATTPGQRIYAYVNGAWHYVDLT